MAVPTSTPNTLTTGLASITNALRVPRRSSASIFNAALARVAIPVREQSRRPYGLPTRCPGRSFLLSRAGASKMRECDRDQCRPLLPCELVKLESGRFAWLCAKCRALWGRDPVVYARRPRSAA